MVRLFLAASLYMSALGACAHIEPHHVALGVADAAIAFDVCQTMRTAADGWPNGVREGNLLLGAEPRPGEIMLYNVAAVTALHSVTHAMPKRWKILPAMAVIVVQAMVINYNMFTSTHRGCFN